MRDDHRGDSQPHMTDQCCQPVLSYINARVALLWACQWRCAYVDTKVIANQQQLFPRFFRSDKLTVVTRTLPNDAHPGHWAGRCPPMISSHLKAATIISPILSI